MKQFILFVLLTISIISNAQKVRSEIPYDSLKNQIVYSGEILSNLSKDTMRKRYNEWLTLNKYEQRSNEFENVFLNHNQFNVYSYSPFKDSILIGTVDYTIVVIFTQNSYYYTIYRFNHTGIKLTYNSLPSYNNAENMISKTKRIDCYTRNGICNNILYQIDNNIDCILESLKKCLVN